jgi:cytochrome c553
VLGCLGCHGPELTGNDWSEPGVVTMWSANLTRAVARMNDGELAHVITSGRRPDGRELWQMPSHLFTHLAAADMRALIAFLRSRPPRGIEHPPPRFTAAGRRQVEQGLFKSSVTQVREEGGAWPPPAPNAVLARYIVRATCAECHDMDLHARHPWPGATPADLTSVVPAYERADFRRLRRTGRAAGGRELGLMGEVARGRYRHLTDAEVDAIYDYLHALSADP